MSKLVSGREIAKGRREGREERDEKPWGCWAGELWWLGGVEWREGDVGRGLQVVFAKLKGQQLEPIC